MSGERVREITAEQIEVIKRIYGVDELEGGRRNGKTLQWHIGLLTGEITRLTAELEQVRRERDRAMSCVRDYGCSSCKYAGSADRQACINCANHISADGTRGTDYNWEWKGAKEGAE